MGMDEKTITLPCGSTATVQALDGVSQEILTNEDHLKSGKWFDLVLNRVVKSLDHREGGALAENHLLNLPSGSRLRCMIESRRLSYGDEVELKWQCIECGEKGKRALDLSKVSDVPYSTFEPQKYTTKFRGVSIEIGWGNGHSERTFLHAIMKKQIAKTHEPLARIVKVGGETLGPFYFAKLNGGVLNEMIAAVRSTMPRLFINPDESDVTETGLSVGGPRSRIQVECQSCGTRMTKDLEAAPDFLHRNLLQAAD